MNGWVLKLGPGLDGVPSEWVEDWALEALEEEDIGQTALFMEWSEPWALWWSRP